MSTPVVIEGIRDGRKLAAIKDLRAAALIGLREVRDIIDRVTGPRDLQTGAYIGGLPQRVVIPAGKLRRLDDSGALVWRRVVRISQDDLLAALEAFPAGMRIGDLRRTLEAAASLARVDEDAAS